MLLRDTIVLGVLFTKHPPRKGTVMVGTGDALFDLTPEVQAFVSDLGLCVVACLLAVRIPPLARRLFAKYDMDRLVLPPGTPATPDGEKSLPAAVAGGLVGCTCLILPIMAFASHERLAKGAGAIAPFVVGAWTAFLAVGGAMLLARWFAQILLEFLDMPGMRARLGNRLSAPAPEASIGSGRLGEKEKQGADPLSLFIARLGYFAVVLVGVVGAAEIAGLTTASTLLSSGVSGTGRLVLALCVAGAVLLGARMMASPSTAQRPGPEASRSRPSTAVIGAVLVGFFVLLGKDAVVLLIVVGAVVFFWQRCRSSLPDLLAGVYLRFSADKEIQLAGGTVDRAELGAVETLIKGEGKERRVPNREILDQHIRASKAGEAKQPVAPVPPPVPQEPTDGVSRDSSAEEG